MDYNENNTQILVWLMTETVELTLNYAAILMTSSGEVFGYMNPFNKKLACRCVDKVFTSFQQILALY